MPPSSRISHFELLGPLGSGGMGTVYKARDLTLDRLVALKFLPHELAAVPELKARFLREARAAAAVAHPNVTAIHDVVEADGETFLCLEYVDGPSMRQLVAQHPLPLDQTVRVAIGVARALTAAHARGVVHRDIKSDNILLASDGTPKVTDFGLAAVAESTEITAPGSIMGTVAYMSPEQAEGREVDRRSDLWSLGVALYEWITGRLPFRGERNEAVLYAIRTMEPEPPTALRTGVPMELERIVLKCLRKDADLRYLHAEDLLGDLRALEASGALGSRYREAASAAAPVTAAPAARSGARARRVAVGAGVLVLTVAAVLVVPRLRRSIASGLRGAVTPPSIAVLYFQNFGERGADDYLAEGVTEEVTTSLAQIPGLKVTSRTAVERYRGRQVSLQQIARDLNVRYILEGSIRKSGDQLRATAQLIRAQDGFHVWADRFDGSLANLFAVEDTIAARIASALRVALVPETRARIARRWTENPRAYAAFLTGRQIYFDRAAPDASGRARPWFEQALALDPDYAPALAGLADVLIAEWDGGERPPDAQDRALELARKAERLDPTLAVAWRAEARFHRRRGHLEEARAACRHALELDPRSSESWPLMAGIHSDLGDRPHAEEAIRKGLDADPLWPAAYTERWLYDAWGDHERARVLLESGLARLPGHPQLRYDLAMHLSGRGRHGEALDTLRSVLASRPDYFPAHEAIVAELRQIGRGAEADSVTRAVLSRWPDVPRALTWGGRQANVSGRFASAESLLRRALAIDEHWYPAWQSLGSCYQGMQRTADADRVLQELARRWPDEPDVCDYIANWYFATRRFGVGERWAEKAIRLDPRSPFGYATLAWACRDVGQYDRAAELFRKAIPLTPGRADYYRGLAQVLANSGKYAEAVAPAQRAVDLSPGTLPNFITLGYVLDSAGRTVEAAAAWERALAVDSTSTGALNNLAGYYLETGRPQKALAMYRRAAAADTAKAIYWSNIAELAFVHLNDMGLAREAATTCIRKAFGGFFAANGHLIIGLVEDRMGRHSAAAEAYKLGLREVGAALKQNPNAPDFRVTAGILSARAGDVAQARRHADWLVRHHGSSPDVLQAAASISALCGDRDAALERLRRAIAAGFDDQLTLERDPAWVGLQGDPAFKQLLASVR